MAGYYFFYCLQMHMDHRGFCPEVLAMRMNTALLLSKLSAVTLLLSSLRSLRT